jgi:Holliday junction resolvase RusA-like endonuclease
MRRKPSLNGEIVEKRNPARLPLTFLLYGTVPSKKNSRINTRSGRSFPSERYSAWHKQVIRTLPAVTVEGPVCINMAFALDSLRSRDLTNMAESVMDLLVDAGILADDNWKVCPEITLTGRLDRIAPGVAISIRAKEIK